MVLTDPSGASLPGRQNSGSVAALGPADLHTQAVEADSHRAALQQLQQRLLAVQQERDKAAATVVELQDELAQQRAAARLWFSTRQTRWAATQAEPPPPRGGA